MDLFNDGTSKSGKKVRNSGAGDAELSASAAGAGVDAALTSLSTALFPCLVPKSDKTQAATKLPHVANMICRIYKKALEVDLKELAPAKQRGTTCVDRHNLLRTRTEACHK